VARWRAQVPERELEQRPHVPGVHARLRERTSMSFPQNEETSSSGAAGIAVSRFRERRGAQVPRVAPRQRGRGARVGAVRSAASTGLLRRRLRDEALGAEHHSAVARRPQAVADRGRMSETGTPTRPATRGLRAPAARPALRHPAERPAPQAQEPTDQRAHRRTAADYFVGNRKGLASPRIASSHRRKLRRWSRFEAMPGPGFACDRGQALPHPRMTGSR
jgi:hypothetical protein